jgi:integrase
MERTIVDAAASWVAECEDLGLYTAERYLYSLSSFTRCGALAVSEIERHCVQRWLDSERARGVSGATCRRNHAAVVSLARWLEARGEFSATRLAELRNMRVRGSTPPPIRWLTAEESDRLTAAADQVHEKLGLAVRLAVHSGLRPGELRQLEREELKLEEELPYVQVRRTKGRETKTRRERTAAVVKWFAEERLESGLLPEKGPLFPSGGRGSVSRYMPVEKLDRWLAVARERAGLGADVTFYSCRHTYASRLVQRRVDLPLVATWMGNSPAVCWKHYVALVPGGHPDVELGFTRTSRKSARGGRCPGHPKGLGDRS